ncbi:hypothetical protein [Streptomyces sp. CMB-StM0423]|uniref:hypothetical protein n=1 Tax=Streptomyces sp. CMB-StM0423 TaxID=2059884 RepID=UPI001F3CF793|nr:hypothetical protein [Streptomyces sp. CMB-StM0423]
MKRLTKFLDLPLVQRFLGNRLAIGAACALMVVTGVAAAMLTTGGTEPVSDAKSAVRDTAAEVAEPEDRSEEESGEQAEEEAGAQSGQEQAAEPRSGGRIRRSAASSRPRPPAASTTRSAAPPAKDTGSPPRSTTARSSSAAPSPPARTRPRAPTANRAGAGGRGWPTTAAN